MQQANRYFNILDEGDLFELSLYQDGHKVGGAVFPFDHLGEDEAFALAVALGESFAPGTTEAPLQGPLKGRMITS